MNTHIVKIMSGIALIVGFTQAALANSDENTDRKNRTHNYNIETIDLTSTDLPVSHLNKVMSDRKTKGLSSLSSGQSFLNYQINGKSFTKAFRVKNRIFSSVPDVKKMSIPAVTEIGDNRK